MERFKWLVAKVSGHVKSQILQLPLAQDSTVKLYNLLMILLVLISIKQLKQCHVTVLDQIYLSTANLTNKLQLTKQNYYYTQTST